MNAQILRTFFLAGGIALLAATAHAEERVVNKVISVKEGDKLVMKVDRGSIDISTHDQPTIKVEIALKLDRVSSEAAKEVFDSHKVDLSQSDGVVLLESEYKTSGGILSWRRPKNRLQVHYQVLVPEKFNVDVATAGGSIKISELEGEVACKTSGGNLRLGSIQGPIQARTSGGSIHLDSTTGDADVRTSGGNIEIGKVNGNLVAKTSGGSIKVDSAGGTVMAETSGGNIRVKNSAGAINAHTSGGSVSAELASVPQGNCEFKTSGGNVDLTLPGTAAITLAARTSGGRVHSDFPGEFNKLRTHMSATLNGGGPDMLLQTSGGSIHIRKK